MGKVNPEEPQAEASPDEGALAEPARKADAVLGAAKKGPAAGKAAPATKVAAEQDARLPAGRRTLFIQAHDFHAPTVRSRDSTLCIRFWVPVCS